jgi:hypothetical protein
MTLLTEYVAGSEVAEVYTLDKVATEDIFEVWLILTVKEIPVKVLQFGVISPKINGINFEWLNTPANKKKLKQQFDITLEGCYGKGSNIIVDMINIGDDYLSSFQPMTIYNWEQDQVNLVQRKYDEDEQNTINLQFGTTSWLEYGEPDIQELMPDDEDEDDDLDLGLWEDALK